MNGCRVIYMLMGMKANEATKSFNKYPLHGIDRNVQQVSKLSLTPCQCFHLSWDIKTGGKEMRQQEKQQINMQEAKKKQDKRHQRGRKRVSKDE